MQSSVPGQLNGMVAAARNEVMLKKVLLGLCVFLAAALFAGAGKEVARSLWSKWHQPAAKFSASDWATRSPGTTGISVNLPVEPLPMPQEHASSGGPTQEAYKVNVEGVEVALSKLTLPSTSRFDLESAAQGVIASVGQHILSKGGVIESTTVEDVVRSQLLGKTMKGVFRQGRELYVYRGFLLAEENQAWMLVVGHPDLPETRYLAWKVLESFEVRR